MCRGIQYAFDSFPDGYLQSALATPSWEPRGSMPGPGYDPPWSSRYRARNSASSPGGVDFRKAWYTSSSFTLLPSDWASRKIYLKAADVASSPNVS